MSQASSISKDLAKINRSKIDRVVLSSYLHIRSLEYLFSHFYVVKHFLTGRNFKMPVPSSMDGSELFSISGHSILKHCQ